MVKKSVCKTIQRTHYAGKTMFKANRLAPLRNDTRRKLTLPFNPLL